MDFLNKLLGKVGQVAGQRANNVKVNTKNTLASLERLLGGSIQNASVPKRNLTDIPHVWGTLAVQNAADQQGYQPWFRNLVQGTNPTVGNIVGGQGVGADYLPGVNQIELRPNQLDPYTITHEGLHAAFQRKSQGAQDAFAKIAQLATPTQQMLLNSRGQLGNAIYEGQRPLTEVHSYLPQAGEGSPTQSYYNHYFTNPRFSTGPNPKYAIANATGFNTRAPGRPIPTPQFSDQFGDY